jgi:hypothetical protein
MVIKFTPKFNKQQIKQVVEAKKKRIRQAIVLRFSSAGENFIKNARNNGNYQDQTGNLRSSVGYAILENGVQLEIGGFEPVAGSAKGRQTLLGKAVGYSFLQQVAAGFPKGIVLICVAGMDYAAAVESKNYDVITGSVLELELELKEGFQQLQNNL